MMCLVQMFFLDSIFCFLFFCLGFLDIIVFLVDLSISDHINYNHGVAWILIDASGVLLTDFIVQGTILVFVYSVK